MTVSPCWAADAGRTAIGWWSIPERNDPERHHSSDHTLCDRPNAYRVTGWRTASRHSQDLSWLTFGDALARVGIELRSLHLYGVETDSDVGRVVERIRAARTRTTTAQNALLELQKRHRKALKTIETDRAARLTNLSRSLLRGLKWLKQHSMNGPRMLIQHSETPKICRTETEVDQIRLEALRSASRHKHDALETRVKALANAGTELDLEIAERVMGGAAGRGDIFFWGGRNEACRHHRQLLDRLFERHFRWHCIQSADSRR